MQVIQGSNNIDVMLKMYDIVRRAPESGPRGLKTRDVANLAVILDTRICPLTSFNARKLNLDYAKKEWLWYIKADPMDDSIVEHAKAWQKLKQPDGSFASNYGQYIFGPSFDESQFKYVIKTLIGDRDSRRASMMFLNRDHLYEGNVDTVCTYAINFRIIDGYLNMTVMMRSNDVIFGFTNDAFCFWNLYHFVYAMLADKMDGLKMGSYTHLVNSMHVYERHFDMISDIVREASPGYIRQAVPVPTSEDVKHLLKGDHDFSSPYITWLTS